MRKISDELRERLGAQRGDNVSPLPISSFVWVGWPLDADGEKTFRCCYSTLDFAVTMDGKRYEGENLLLDFNEEEGTPPFVMSKDDLFYGASCGFRIFDAEGLARKVVTGANAKGDFPAIYCEAWLHFSKDAREIESLCYGEMVFGGHITRIELQEDTDGRNIAKIWGGHEGVVISKMRLDSVAAASVVGGRISWSRRVDKLLRQRGATQ